MAIATIDAAAVGTMDKPKRNPSSKLGKDDFLRLLTTQLQYQDPLQPMQDTEFVSQMANYSTLEEMMNVNKTLDEFHSAYETNAKTQAMMYLGAKVTAKSEDMELPVSGTVEKISFKDGVPYLEVGGHSFGLNEVSTASY